MARQESRRRVAKHRWLVVLLSTAIVLSVSLVGCDKGTGALRYGPAERIPAAGYVTIAQNSYHPDGRSEGEFVV